MDRLKAIFNKSRKLIPQGVTMFRQSNMPVFSGYATLFIATSVIPFIILIISVVNLLPGYSTKDVLHILFQILPDLELVKELVESLVTDLKAQSGGLLASMAALTTLWSASKGAMAIQKGINQLDRKGPGQEPAPQPAEEVEAAKQEAAGVIDELLSKGSIGELVSRAGGIDEIRSKGRAPVIRILKRLIFTLFFVILIPALLVFQMLEDTFAKIVSSVVTRLDPDVPDATLHNIESFFDISTLLVFLLALLVVLLIYALLPEVHRTLKSQLPGALLAVICLIAFTELFAFFIPMIYHASNFYGTLAAVFLLIMWLRFVVMILFAGSVLNRTLEEERRAAGGAVV